MTLPHAKQTNTYSPVPKKRKMLYFLLGKLLYKYFKRENLWERRNVRIAANGDKADRSMTNR